METGDAFSEDALEAGRVLFAGSVVFVKGVVDLKGLPTADRPEVCFAGRSNVGKSSLINALVGMKGLARASNEPGRTREVNFFELDGRMRLVDLPGYGWAKASKGEVKRFQNLGRDYLRGRVTLKRVYLLIDARHGLKSVDTEALDALDLAAVSYQIVLTKADARKAGLNTDDLAFVGRAYTANGEVRTAPVRLERVAVGPLVDEDVRAVVNEGELDQSLLGMEYLQRYSSVEITNGTLVLTR